MIATIVRDALDANRLTTARPRIGGVAPVEPDVLELITGAGDERFADLAVRALAAWTLLVGAINMELFGHFNNVVSDPDVWFDDAMNLAADVVGLA